VRLLETVSLFLLFGTPRPHRPIRPFANSSISRFAGSPVTDRSSSERTAPRLAVGLRVTRTLTGARLRVDGISARSIRVFVVGGPGLRVFRQARLERQPDGGFAVDLALEDTGLYMAYVEFVPASGWPQMAQQAFTIGSAIAVRASEPADEPHASNGIAAAIDLAHVRAGVESPLAFDVADATLSAPAEAFIVSSDLTDAQHLAAQPTSGGGHLVFSAIFPHPGRYKVWLIAQRNGQTGTIPFVIDVN